MKAEVRVRPKRTVLDPQGRAVLGGLKALGFDEVADVRVGKLIEMKLAEKDESKARERVTAMCEKLLANGVIEEYSFSLTPE